MATLASSAVASYPTNLSREQYPRGKGDRTVITRSLKLTLTGQGGQTNTITAAALGFNTLLGASALWDAQNAKGYPAVIDPVNNLLILLDGSAAPAPVDVSSTGGYITVWGNPSLTTS